jgi:hypothetical protein
MGEWNAGPIDRRSIEPVKPQIVLTVDHPVAANLPKIWQNGV